MNSQYLPALATKTMNRLSWLKVAQAMLFAISLHGSITSAAEELSKLTSLEAGRNDDHRILAELDPVPFTEIEEKILVIDERTSRRPLTTGPSFAVSISLPEDRNWTELLIYSYRRPELFYRNRAFFPEVAILDEQRRYVRTFSAKDFIVVGQTADEPLRLSAYIELNPDPKVERYLVIYTTSDALELERSLIEKTRLSTTFMPTFIRGLPILPVPELVTPEHRIGGLETGSIKLKVNRPLRLND